MLLKWQQRDLSKTFNRTQESVGRCQKSKMKNNQADLDLMTTRNLVDLFLKKEIKAISSIKKEKKKITQTINAILKKLSKDGRVIYVGAGTSGRLGVLDAVECKPTFSTNSFLGIIAGGKNALFKAIEGAEDGKTSAIKDLNKLKIKKDDVIIGISASGETPYTISVLRHAKKKKALTVAVSSNQKSHLAKVAAYKICPKIDNELITGSTRLSSATVQKIILNMISSIAMIKSGKVYGNLMIDVEPKNKKLINRAIRIISIICKVSLNKASGLFQKAKGNTKAAIVMYKKNYDLEKAISLLKSKGFNLRKIIK